MSTSVVLGLGSNLGNRELYLQSAVEQLNKCGVTDMKISSIYESKPWGYLRQQNFFNLVLAGKVSCSARALLALCKQIEKNFGRVKGVRYGPRVIDIDILLYGFHLVRLHDLEIPHPRMMERAFVLAPLAEVRPNVIHPLLYKPMRALWDTYKERHGSDMIIRTFPFESYK